MTPGELAAAARDLIARPDAAAAGVWPRTSALLARQAIEQAVTTLWESLPETAGLATCRMRSQLTCLPSYIDQTAARQTAYTWAALSNACHYHPYELAPTAAELTRWIDDTTELITRITDRTTPADRRE
jgi:carbohydrate-binding DOMON domain-containing protein